MEQFPRLMPKDIDKYFFNREKEIDQLNTYLSMLEKDIPNQILLTGYRGVGKTFLLRKLLKDQPPQFLTLYLDLSEIYGRQRGKISEEEVMKELLNLINEIVIKDKNLYSKIKTKFLNFISDLRLKDYDFVAGANIFDIPLPEIRNNYNKLSKFVMELPQNIVDYSDDVKGFIIVFDEFQLLRYIENPEAFFWLIRSFSQKQFNVSYIFTGSTSQTAKIIKMLNGTDGAFGGRMIQININPFTEDETKRFIDEKAEGIEFTDEGFERFYSCTRGIPAYINSFCSVLPNDRVSTGDLIKEKILLNIDQVATVWIYVWGRLSYVEKEIIVTILEHEEISIIDLSELLDYSRATMYRYLDSLNNKGIIEFTYNKKYILADKMLSLWLKNKYETNGFYPF